MPDKAWKNRERLVARFFGGVRNALSGINSKVTHSDVVHDNLFIECKLRAKHSAVKLWDDTKVLADKEKKTPVIALCENCLLYTSPSPRDATLSRMPSSA